MDTIVMKFGGSSVADNIKLNLVADKIIGFYKQNYHVAVVVSAQGKTTDSLIKQAKELSALPDEREMDVLLSTGEQVTTAKLSILLNRLGYQAISLTGWQAGICTEGNYQDSKIATIDIQRIEKELEKGKIVIIAGFQGINENSDITTLGRGGSDTTAVAIAAALQAKHCYIFSDVDGVYTTDPNKITEAKKLESLSYEEMLDISNEGAKVLHNRCIEIGQKYHIPIITKSTFNNQPGTVIQEKMEDTSVKSIVKNDDLLYVQLKAQKYSISFLNELYQYFLRNGIILHHLTNHSTYQFHITFTIKGDQLNKFETLLEKQYTNLDIRYNTISRIAIVGYGLMNDHHVLQSVIKILDQNQLEILDLEVNESKISIMLKDVITNAFLEQLHHELIHG